MADKLKFTKHTPSSLKRRMPPPMEGKSNLKQQQMKNMNQGGADSGLVQWLVDFGSKDATTWGLGQDVLGLFGAGGITNPYMAIGTAVMNGVSAMRENKAIMAEARNNARHLREQGDSVLRQAGRQAEDVRDEERFRSTEEARQLRNTGFLTGSESFARGTGVGSVFEANRKAAEGLAGDIMAEAEKQKQQYDRAAKAQMDAADERRKGNIIGRITKNIPLVKDL